MDERLIDYFAGRLAEEERLVLLRELDSNPNLRADYIRMRNFQAMEAYTRSYGRDAATERRCKRFVDTARRKEHRIIVWRMVSYAAMVAALLLGGWILLNLNHQPEAGCLTWSVPVGQSSQMVMTDGTEVWLNSGSTLRYSASLFGGQRRVELTGEGYFHVAKDERHPFVVETAAARIRVTGTTFNVVARDNQADVSLIEGSVEVSGASGRTVRMRPMQTLHVDGDTFEMHRLEGTDAFLWRDNMIYFANESLADIADKLERQFSISIRIDKPTLGESRFTGRFRLSDGPSEILRILSLTHPFAIAYGDTPNTIILE